MDEATWVREQLAMTQFPLALLAKLVRETPFRAAAVLNLYLQVQGITIRQFERLVYDAARDPVYFNSVQDAQCLGVNLRETLPE